LLDLFEVEGSRREELETRIRAKSEEIVHPIYGRALLRDQKPLNEKKLAKVLQDGLSPEDWLRLLNRKAFFWAHEGRLGKLQNAREYQGDRQTIIVVDASRLIERHGHRITLCLMNSGATRPMARERGLYTFLPIDEYPLVERRKKAGIDGAVAEVTVDYSVPDVRDFVVEAYEIGGGRAKEVFR